MKTLFSVMILMIGLLVTLPYGNQAKASILPDQTSFAVDNHQIAPAALAQEEGGVPAKTEQTNVVQETTGSFITDNWGTLVIGLLGFFDVVARLTPTEKDNSIIIFLMSFFNAIIPNLKKGGGRF